jgi:hypothetical protein
MPKFHEYPKFIQKGLVEQGYDVDVFYDFSTDSLYNKLKNSNSKVLTVYTGFHKKKTLRKIKSNNYNKVFVIRGCGFDDDFYKALKEIQSHAVFYLYQWDSLKNFNYLDVISNFDKVYSFDRVDCSHNVNLHIKYHPLFYVSKAPYSGERRYDVFFVGGMTLERYCWLDEFEKELVRNNISYYFYRYVSPAQYFNLLLKGRFLNPFKLKFISLNYKGMSNYFSKSKLVIDIAHGLQTGLTMRTFDALANGCKIITNNRFIQSEKFYIPSNIVVLNLNDSNTLNEISAIINIPFVKINNFEDYNISQWLIRILS